MPRPRILNSRSDYSDASTEGNGFRILTNVSFNGSDPETIRLDLRTRNSCRRSEARDRTSFNPEDTPFEVMSPAVLLTSEQLRELQDNFAIVHRAVGDARLPSISIDHDENSNILPRIQACSQDLIWIDKFPEKVSVNSQLYQSYLLHPKAIPLFDQGQLTERGQRLLVEFEEAAALYAQVPELRNYLLQNDARQGDLGPSGERFRERLEENGSLQLCDDVHLEYVAYGLRPLRISGALFQWKWDPLDAAPLGSITQDPRMLAIDLLLKHQGQPIWCEVKANNDNWTSSALQQILLYGSMICSGNQIRRCRQHFPDTFSSFRPWFGIIVQQQEDARFQGDFDQTLAYAQNEEVQQILRQHFVGALFIIMDSNWHVIRFEEVLF